MNQEKNYSRSRETIQDQTEKTIQAYEGLNNGRLAIDELGCDNCHYLEKELSLKTLNVEKIEHLIDSIQSKEKILADMESLMKTYEAQIGQDPNTSPLYDNCWDDLLVKTAILYPYRINCLRQATHDPSVSQPFAEAVVGYLQSIDALQTCTDQAEREDLNISRIQAHNHLIGQFNELNDLCRQHQLSPLTYRNFIPSSPANNYKLNLQQWHDRATVANYMIQLLESGVNLDPDDAMTELVVNQEQKNKVVSLLKR